MFEIEKGIPLPSLVKNPLGAPTGPRNRPNHRYPFEHMEIGDSFKVPCNGDVNTAGVDQTLARVSNAAQQQKRRLDRENNCVRCWRVA